jgi:HAD superfamily hydrolase (TIGR01509 family)
LKLDVEPIIQEKRVLALKLMEDNLSAIPGSIELMKFFNRKGLRQAIASNSNGKAIEDVLERLGVRDFFEVIVSSGDSSKGKPDPEPYLLAVKRLAEPAGNCFAIEDSPQGIQSAKGAGLACFALKTRYFSEAELGKADFIVSNLLDVRSLAERL